MAVARLASTSLDWSDPAALVDFWAALLGGEVARGRDEVCTVRTGNRWIAAVRIGDQRPPTWPAADAPKQIHPDQARSGMAEAEASGLGARKAADQPALDRWLVWFGPAGPPYGFT